MRILDDSLTIHNIPKLVKFSVKYRPTLIGCSGMEKRTPLTSATSFHTDMHAFTCKTG